MSSEFSGYIAKLLNISSISVFSFSRIYQHYTVRFFHCQIEHQEDKPPSYQLQYSSFLAVKIIICTIKYRESKHYFIQRIKIQIKLNLLFILLFICRYFSVEYLCIVRYSKKTVVNQSFRRKQVNGFAQREIWPSAPRRVIVHVSGNRKLSFVLISSS